MSLKRLIIISLILNLLLLGFYAFRGFKGEIPLYMIGIHLLYALFYTGGILFSNKIHRPRNIYILVFLYSLVFSFLIRFCFINFDYSLFGPAVDSYWYHETASSALIDNSNLWTYLKSLGANVNSDDLGYPTILYFVYQIAGTAELGATLMLFVNAFAIAGISRYILKICSCLGYEKQASFSFAILIALFPFFSVTSSVGLKECIFSYFVTGALYYMHEFSFTHKKINIWLFVLYAGVCYFFRNIITVMLGLSFIVSLASTEMNKKSMRVVLVVGLIVGSFFINFFISEFTYTTYEHILNVTENRLIDDSGRVSQSAWFSQVLSAIIGPFPNYNYAVQYGFIHSFGLLVKLLLGYTFIRGIVHIFRNSFYKYYPILTFVIMGIIMLVMSGVALDMRFHITFFPAVMLISALIFNDKIKIKYYWIYIFFSIAVILLYNNR